MQDKAEIKILNQTIKVLELYVFQTNIMTTDVFEKSCQFSLKKRAQRLLFPARNPYFTIGNWELFPCTSNYQRQVRKFAPEPKCVSRCESTHE